MNEWTEPTASPADETNTDAATARSLWTRRNAFAVTAGFFAMAAAPARASLYVQSAMPRATQIVVSKSNRVLQLMNGDEVLRRYRIHLGFEPNGHKTRSGDGRTPEGLYYIDRRNPRSDYYLSLGISYPNAEDLIRARAQGVEPGGDIFIHGGPTRAEDKNKKDWTAGCIAVSDSEIEEIWSIVPTGVPIAILA